MQYLLIEIAEGMRWWQVDIWCIIGLRERVLD